MDIHLDLATGVKWVVYKDTTPLTKDENNRLMIRLSLLYVDLVNEILVNFKLPPCAGEINMLTTINLSQPKYEAAKTRILEPVFGMYKMDGLIEKINEFSFDPDEERNVRAKDIVTSLVISSRAHNQLPVRIDDVKEKFRTCALKNYFVVPLVLRPVTWDIENVPPAHQNILVIAKNRGTVYWIEPQTIGNARFQQAMIKAIRNLVADIGMPDATVISPVETCILPQGVTGDENCMFWALIIFMLIMLNQGTRDHNQLVNAFTARYNTPELLGNYVNGLKRQLFNMMTRPAAGRKRTIKKRHSKKRRTHRRRKFTS